MITQPLHAFSLSADRSRGGTSTRPATCRPTARLVRQHQRHVERLREVLLGDDLADRAVGHDPAPRSSRAWVKPGGISSTWCETSTVAGDAGSSARVGQRRDQVLATAEVEAGRGLVEQQQLGVGHQRPGDLHPLALALAEGAEGAVEQVVGADLGEQLRGRARGRGRRTPRASARPRRTTRRRRRRGPARRAGCARRGPRWSARSAGRSSNTSTVPSTSSRIPATPSVGWIWAEATWSSVVLPAPLGPSTTQRSPSATRHEIWSSSVAWPRRTVTPANSITATMRQP